MKAMRKKIRALLWWREGLTERQREYLLGRFGRIEMRTGKFPSIEEARVLYKGLMAESDAPDCLNAVMPNDKDQPERSDRLD